MLWIKKRTDLHEEKCFLTNDTMETDLHHRDKYTVWISGLSEIVIVKFQFMALALKQRFTSVIRKILFSSRLYKLRVKDWKALVGMVI